MKITTMIVMLTAIITIILFVGTCYFIITSIDSIGLTYGLAYNDSCNIGNDEIVGDFEGGSTLFSQRYCAVRDCLAFNKVQDGLRCVV